MEQKRRPQRISGRSDLTFRADRANDEGRAEEEILRARLFLARPIFAIERYEFADQLFRIPPLSHLVAAQKGGSLSSLDLRQNALRAPDDHAIERGQIEAAAVPKFAQSYRGTPSIAGNERVAKPLNGALENLFGAPWRPLSFAFRFLLMREDDGRVQLLRASGFDLVKAWLEADLGFVHRAREVFFGLLERFDVFGKTHQAKEATCRRMPMTAPLDA